MKAANLILEHFAVYNNLCFGIHCCVHHAVCDLLYKITGIKRIDAQIDHLEAVRIYEKKLTFLITCFVTPNIPIFLNKLLVSQQAVNDWFTSN